MVPALGDPPPDPPSPSVSNPEPSASTGQSGGSGDDSSVDTGGQQSGSGPGPWIDNTPAAIQGLTLSPDHGDAGTSFTATATGFDGCRSVTFQWDGSWLGDAFVVIDSGMGFFNIPAGVRPGEHKVTASCGDQDATAWFTVNDMSALTLEPDNGAPGTSFTATATGFAACGTVSFQWDDTALEPANAGNGSAVGHFAVPGDASTSTHTVTASCGGAQAPATFTVTATENPALALAPMQGGAAMQVTATATGFGACRAMSFQWDGQPLQTSPAGSDDPAVTFVVPNDASAGDHKVTVSCEGKQAPATFTVVVTPKPTLTLNTGKGSRGSHVTASGSGFACGDDGVQLLWNGDTHLTNAPSGTFTVPLTVPSQASLGGHTVVASCRNHPDISDRQPFTVTSEPTSSTGLLP